MKKIAQHLKSTLGIECECFALPDAGCSVSLRDEIACNAWLERQRGQHFWRWARMILNGGVTFDPKPRAEIREILTLHS